MAGTGPLRVGTPSGPAAVHLDDGDPAAAVLVLGHGAGGGIEAPDLLAARAAALALGLRVARVEQPWRVRGRRVAEAPPRLDAAWLAVLATLPGPYVLGGRSSGARTACRTAAHVGDVRAVLCLAFPLLPPGGTRSRAPELAIPLVPRLVVQGARDAFGVPPAGPGVQVHVVPGADHGFAVRRRDGRSSREDVDAEVRDAVRAWLDAQALG